MNYSVSNINKVLYMLKKKSSLFMYTLIQIYYFIPIPRIQYSPVPRSCSLHYKYKFIFLLSRNNFIMRQRRIQYNMSTNKLFKHAHIVVPNASHTYRMWCIAKQTERDHFQYNNFLNTAAIAAVAD